ncbi:Multicopper oxidase [Mycena sanguinolenta]|uniref:Multicopper oxidase n=1 Tax=Mycena sanguinolenta TaxID=230812 RepID=A0A8H6YLK8_9AGAR|nr:Multicopper oxidase [Mycena sanguinolenta]
MSDRWPAAADDEQAALISGSEVDADAKPRWEQPSRRKRVSAVSVLVMLLIPFVFLLWMISWPKRHAAEESDAAFVLNPAFDLAAAPQTRVYNWTVSRVPIPSIDGKQLMCTVVNGRSPGPLIEANVGDRILVYVTNGLADNGTSIHWHGLPLPDTPFYDGTAGISQCPIPPGETMLYNFTFGTWSGTTWWHGHTDMQHTDGLYGPLIVHAPDEAVAHNYTAEHVLTFADILETPGEELLPTYMTSHPVETVAEPVPDFAMINGMGGGTHPLDVEERSPPDPDTLRRSNIRRGTPVHAARASGETHGPEDNPGYPVPAPDAAKGYYEIKVEEGTTTRLRLIHAGTFAPLRVSIDTHVLNIIEADGIPVQPVGVRDILLQPAQRYSVLVSRDPADTKTDFWIRASMVDDKFAYVNHNMQPEARAILRYYNSTAPPAPTESAAPLPTSRPGPLRTLVGEYEWYSLPQFNEWWLYPATSTAMSFPNTDIHTIPFIFSIQRTHDLNWRSFINGTSWEIPPREEAALVRDTAGIYSSAGGTEGVTVFPGDQLIATTKFNQTVDFVITNLDDGDHPFHIHGYAPWLLGVGPGRYKAAKDYQNLNLTSPFRRDTFTVPSRGWAVVRIVADNPGYWALHCHIVWHMMGGGLFQLAVPPSADRAGMALPLPDDITQQCQKWGV